MGLYGRASAGIAGAFPRAALAHCCFQPVTIHDADGRRPADGAAPPVATNFAGGTDMLAASCHAPPPDASLRWRCRHGPLVEAEQERLPQCYLPRNCQKKSATMTRHYFSVGLARMMASCRYFVRGSRQLPRQVLSAADTGLPLDDFFDGQPTFEQRRVSCLKLESGANQVGPIWSVNTAAGFPRRKMRNTHTRRRWAKLLA